MHVYQRLVDFVGCRFNLIVGSSVDVSGLR